MSLSINICETFGEQMDFESCLLQVFACVAYAVFRCDAADIDISGVKKFKNFSERLLCVVLCFEARVLLGSFVATFVKGKLFAGIWRKTFMNM